jgi:hypothetical protein
LFWTEIIDVNSLHCKHDGGNRGNQSITATFFSIAVNRIFVVICGPKQPLQNCFMLFMFLINQMEAQFSRMLRQFAHLLPQIQRE